MVVDVVVVMATTVVATVVVTVVKVTVVVTVATVVATVVTVVKAMVVTVAMVVIMWRVAGLTDELRSLLGEPTLINGVAAASEADRPRDRAAEAKAEAESEAHALSTDSSIGSIASPPLLPLREPLGTAWSWPSPPSAARSRWLVYDTATASSTRDGTTTTATGRTHESASGIGGPAIPLMGGVVKRLSAAGAEALVAGAPASSATVAVEVAVDFNGHKVSALKFPKPKSPIEAV